MCDDHSTLTGIVQNFSGLLAIRIFLGVAEVSYDYDALLLQYTSTNAITHLGRLLSCW